MATSNEGVVVSRKAGVDLSSAQFSFVKASAGTVVVAGAGEGALGVLINNPADTRGATVALASSFTKIKLGATVAVDVEVMSDAAGLAITATTGNRILGRVLEAGVVNEIVTLHHYLGPIAP